jgi:chromosome partitioning protein
VSAPRAAASDRPGDVWGQVGRPSVVAVAHVKGGVGKSTTAVQLGLHMVGRGLQVLVVDADPGRTALSWRYRAGEAWPAGLTVVPSLQASDFARRVRSLGEGHGVVVIDTPHSPTEGDDVGPVVAAALAVADLVVVPTSPAPADIDRLGDLLQAIRRESDRRAGDVTTSRHPDIPSSPLEWTLLLTKVDLRSRTMLRAMRDRIRMRGLPLLGPVVPMRAGVAQAFGTAEARVEYDAVTGQVLAQLASMRLA